MLAVASCSGAREDRCLENRRGDREGEEEIDYPLLKCLVVFAGILTDALPASFIQQHRAKVVQALA